MNDFSREPRRRPGGHRGRRAVFDDGYPTKHTLLYKKPILTENKVTGSYASVAEYLDTHFDLLLEDFVSPLRDALNQFKRKRNTTLNGARVYSNVKLNSLKDKPFETTCMINTDQWEGDAEPSFGSLIVFTKRDFNESFFLGTVIADTSQTNVSAVELRLKFPRGSEVDLKQLSESHFIMIEGKAFFYVYFHVLRALNLLNETNFPMKQYIVYGNKDTCVKHPAYLRRSTTYKIADHNVLLLSDNWPSSKDLKIDNESQYNALKKALTEEIALVQGPPGTGKTYFGVSLVKVLLDNDAVWNPSGTTPLLIVCQSNEALDNFLEKILVHTKKIVRVGDQCQNKKLKPFALKEKVCREVTKNCDLKTLQDHLESLDKTRKQITQLTQGIVSFKTLEQYEIIGGGTSQLFKCEETFLEWLGIKVKAERKFISESDTDLLVTVEELSQHIYQLELSGEYLLAVCLKRDLQKVRNIIRSHKGNVQKEVSWSDSTILSLSSQDAQNVYLSWLDKYYLKLEEKIEKKLEGFWKILPKKQRYLGTIKVLKSAQIVGLTSTGAASRHEILNELMPPIVIMEEAGELLESHVIVSMTTRCQHLIMMGDHKQLKPGVTTHHLAEDYNLNVSLFERLLKNEVVTGTCLTTQYRMKPEISALLKPHIYSILDDGPGTSGRPAVRGVSKSVFFIDHEERELKSADNTGCWNPHEVGMLINLAQYLVCSKGYATTDITVIAMYSEQKRKLIEARDKVPQLSKLVIASVDSYQGKENEIILLSLVRSNTAGNIGFLREENRVCVALSRARIGLFIVGNMKCLTRGGKMWRHVSQRLKEQSAIDTNLTITCDEHKTTRHIGKVEDWVSKPCFSCLKAASSRSLESPKKSIYLDSPSPLSEPSRVRCTCCQSFYCDKAKESIRLDREIADVFGRLTLRSPPKRRTTVPRN